NDSFLFSLSRGGLASDHVLDVWTTRDRGDFPLSLHSEIKEMTARAALVFDHLEATYREGVSC
ncbi:hypothetical protein CEXT_589241, partial [Caerostris extrusa]